MISCWLKDELIKKRAWNNLHFFLLLSQESTICEYFEDVLVSVSNVSNSICMWVLAGHTDRKKMEKEWRKALRMNNTVNRNFAKHRNYLFSPFPSFPCPLLSAPFPFSPLPSSDSPSPLFSSSCRLFDVALSCPVPARCPRNQMRGSVMPLTPGRPLTSDYFPNNQLLP